MLIQQKTWNLFEDLKAKCTSVAYETLAVNCSGTDNVRIARYVRNADTIDFALACNCMHHK